MNLPVPSGILIYVVEMSAIAGRRFFVANFFGRLPMIVLLTVVDANGFHKPDQFFRKASRKCLSHYHN
jgi:hypothetical protein